MTTVRRQAGVGRDWLGEGQRVVAALLVEVDGSAPLEAGASMLIGGDGSVEGSITGGCVEAAVVQEAQRVLAGGGARTVTYGISDELAGTVGLTCGGIVQVFLHELHGDIAAVESQALDAVANGEAVAVATLLSGERAGAKLALIDGEVVGSLGGELLDHSVARDARGMLGQGQNGLRRYGSEGAALGTDLLVYVRSFSPPPEMLIFGAVDFSAALARLANELGYATTICDPRTPFVQSSRFEGAGTVLVAWPEEAFEAMDLGPRDAVLVFTHDPKFDQPALTGALASGAGYVGALGSRKTTADRNRRLREAGLSEAQLARVHAPCGLDIGGSTPEEIAISVLAEIIAERSHRPGGALRDGTGTISPHARTGGAPGKTASAADSRRL